MNDNSNRNLTGKNYRSEDLKKNITAMKLIARMQNGWGFWKDGNSENDNNYKAIAAEMTWDIIQKQKLIGNLRIWNSK